MTGNGSLSRYYTIVVTFDRKLKQVKATV